ncbi:Hypothetical_protein [Hexamita inflata]|uniref:Hypothetical_protein n=1 Tax=Hexamita inflata TaxID=28002 RepID=A0AA86PR22_9EUKA|nr:Hypothetical protein HINF_LOCUS9599 [Hexamita inflata]CAI9944579.1 Hypothetical protein HINF_LOCUS32224 [Hexamita inflata]CAI9944581.1 Hypothetical protein HINF_LOCUS32226 [Hexamita inflata]
MSKQFKVQILLRFSIFDSVTRTCTNAIDSEGRTQILQQPIQSEIWKQLLIEHCQQQTELLCVQLYLYIWIFGQCYTGYFIYLPNSKFYFGEIKTFVCGQIILAASPATAVRNDK